MNTNVFPYHSDGNFESEFFQQTEESSQFRKEYEMRKMKQACNVPDYFSFFYICSVRLKKVILSDSCL